MCGHHANKPHQDFDKRQFAEDIKRLSQPNNLRSVWAIGGEYLICGSAIGISIWADYWPVYILAAIVVAARQHALAILLHEATHYRLFTSRRINDLVSNLFLAFPLGVSTELYRRYHNRHHRFVNDEQLDPDLTVVQADEDWEWPKTVGEGIWLFARDLTGLSVFRMYKMLWARYSPWPGFVPLLSSKQEYTSSLNERVLLLCWTAMVASLVFATNAWLYVLLLWLVPASTVLIVINRIRALAEHYGIDETHELNHSRTVITSWWERFLLSPHNVNYHLEHHLFPSVPCFRLPELHDCLMQDKVYAREAHLTQGYPGVLFELLEQSSTELDPCLSEPTAVSS